MTNLFHKFPSINQFRHFIKEIKHNNPDLTNIVVYGTPKIHGTNGGVIVSKSNEVYAQSRSSIITPENDNCGFAAWVSRPDVTEWFIETKHLNFGSSSTAIFYGEWFGPGIQRGVGVSLIPNKSFAIFDAGVLYDSESSYEYKPVIGVNEPSLNIYNIFNFGVYSQEIDLQFPNLSVEEMIVRTENIEKECPVAKYFGIDGGIGEGVVYRFVDEKSQVYRFKIKGEKHSSSKVKKLASVDIEKINSIKEFVEYSVTESRLNQAMTETLVMDENGVFDFDRKHLGKFIKWVSEDIRKEESDTLEENKLTMKDVGSDLSRTARDWFFSKEYI